jgi:valyl-tRNA synthetase
MMFSLYFMGDVPFKDVYIHALVRDSKGQKMSKSKGNVMDPLDLIEQYGTDALRFTLCALATQGRDIRLADERLQGYRNFVTKLWNAARYCEMNECVPKAGFDPAAVTYTPNQWIISEVVKAQGAIDKALAEYRFNDAANAAYQFTWGSFCDWYIEFTKSSLQEGGAIAQEVQATSAWVLEQILILLNPFMPYVTEELYASLKGADAPRLINSAWPSYGEELAYGDAAAEIDWLQRFISEIRSVRADMNVPAGAKIELLVKGASDETKARLSTHEEILCRLARLSSAGVSEDTPKGAIQVVVDEATIMLPIADIIDLDAERTRLQKAIDKVEQDIKTVEQKLDNKKFVDNAPVEIIDEHKQRKVDALETRSKLSQALEQLASA